MRMLLFTPPPVGIDWWFAHLRSLSLGGALVAITIYAGFHWKAKKPLHESVGPIVTCGVSGYSLLQCLALLYCAFDPSKLALMQDYTLYLILGSLCAAVLVVAGIVSACRSALPKE